MTTPTGLSDPGELEAKLHRQFTEISDSPVYLQLVTKIPEKTASKKDFPMSVYSSSFVKGRY